MRLTNIFQSYVLCFLLDQAGQFFSEKKIAFGYLYNTLKLANSKFLFKYFL